MCKLGARIKKRRKELNLTQDKLAESSGISKSHLCDVEKGKKDITTAKLLEIARVLSVSLDFLLTGDDKEIEINQVIIPSSLSKYAEEENLAYKEIIALLGMQSSVVKAFRDLKEKNFEDAIFQSHSGLSLPAHLGPFHRIGECLRDL